MQISQRGNTTFHGKLLPQVQYAQLQARMKAQAAALARVRERRRKELDVPAFVAKVVGVCAPSSMCHSWLRDRDVDA